MDVHKVMRAAVILIGIIIVFNIIMFLFGGSRSDLSKSIFAEDIVTINVSTDRGDIQIAPYDGDEIRVQLQGKSEETKSKNFRLTMKEKNNEVTIKAKEKSRLFSFGKSPLGYTILVELPSKQYEKLQVESNVAHIQIDSIQANESQVTTNVGNIVVSGGGGVIHAETKTGNITIKLQNIMNNIAAKSQVGNIIVKTKEEPLVLQTELNNSIGTITINLPNEVDGAIGIGGPLVTLTVEVGNISLLSGE